MSESPSAATDLDLISFLREIPDPRMPRGIRIPAWYLLLVAVLGILSHCQSLRDLERFAKRHHAVLTEAVTFKKDVTPRLIFKRPEPMVLAELSSALLAAC